MDEMFHDFRRFAAASNASKLTEHITYPSFASKFAICRWRKAFDYKPNTVGGKPTYPKHKVGGVQQQCRRWDMVAIARDLGIAYTGDGGASSDAVGGSAAEGGGEVGAEGGGEGGGGSKGGGEGSGGDSSENTEGGIQESQIAGSSAGRKVPAQYQVNPTPGFRYTVPATPGCEGSEHIMGM